MHTRAMPETILHILEPLSYINKIYASYASFLYYGITRMFSYPGIFVVTHLSPQYYIHG